MERGLDLHRQVDAYFTNLHVSPLDLLFCGTQRCKPGHSCGPQLRPYFLMVFVHSGKGVFRTQNRLYQLEKGATFFLFPGQITYYEADQQQPWEYSWIAFSSYTDLKDVEQLLLESAVSAQAPVHSTMQDGVLQGLYRQLLSLGDSPHKSLKVMSLFWDILYQYAITANQLEKEQAPFSCLSPHVSAAISYVKQQYGQGISVQMVADQVGISREHLCTLFKRQYGMSPLEFIGEIRLQSAATLLMTTNYSVEKIAELTGFGNYNYFTKQFKRAYGHSPTKHRKQERI